MQLTAFKSPGVAPGGFGEMLMGNNVIVTCSKEVFFTVTVGMHFTGLARPGLLEYLAGSHSLNECEVSHEAVSISITCVTLKEHCHHL